MDQVLNKIFQGRPEKEILAFSPLQICKMVHLLKERTNFIKPVQNQE